MNVVSPSAETMGIETGASARRVLIDCSLSRFNEQPTGIPRVMLNYLRHGQDFGRRHGIAVIPVELAPNGRFRVRVVTVDKPNRRAIGSPRPVLLLAAKIGLELLRYITRIVMAFLGLLSAMLPFRAVVGATKALSLRTPGFLSWAREGIEYIRGAEYVDGRPGDVLLSPNCGHEVDPSAYDAFRARGGEIVSVVHDILPATLPSFHAYPWRWRFEQKLSRSLDYVGHFYCISKQTLQDLSDYAARRGKTIRASVAYNGFEPLETRCPDATACATHAALLERRPWLMVGTLEPKKGYLEALAAFEALWAAGYQRPLTLIGRCGWMFDEIVENIEASPWRGKRLFWLDRADDEELASFYRNSHALLFASLAEGFGIPLLEAASHGLPIIARDTPTSREILGARGTYFTTNQDLTRSVMSLENSAVYASTLDRLSGLQWFDWHAVIDSVMIDILRPPTQRRTGPNLLECSLMRPVCQAPRRLFVGAAEVGVDASIDVASLSAPRSFLEVRGNRAGAGSDRGNATLREAHPPIRRILVDCSLSRFDERATGIARVVTKYVRLGREFGLRNGIVVAPVKVTSDGHFRIGIASGYRSGAARVTLAWRGLSFFVIGIGLELLLFFTPVAIAITCVFAALLPFRAWLRVTSLWSRCSPAFAARMRDRLELARDFAAFDPGAGDLFLCPNCWHDIDPGIYEALGAKGAEIAFILHDMLPVTMPECYDYPWRWRFEQNLAHSLDYVSHYYCVSYKTFLDLAAFAGRREKSVSASVAYNGFEFPDGKHPSNTAHSLYGRRPWLMVGTLEPKKGYREVLNGFELLWKAGYRRPLVIVGQPGWLCDDIVEGFQSSPWWGERLYWLNDVDDAQLATFYLRAHALLFASRGEGFGLPLLEAASRRLPILAREIPTSREILGSRGVFFTTTEDMIDGVKQFEDPVAYAMAQENLNGLQWFEWRSVVTSVMVDALRRPSERRKGLNLLESSSLAQVIAVSAPSLVRVVVDDARQVRDFVALLEPHSVANFKKIRVGSDHDGGYVMLDDFMGIVAALSFGVDNEVSWDFAVADRGVPVLRDGSNGEVSVRAGGSKAVIEAILASLGAPGDLLLKIDIEGDEWDVLDALDQVSISRFRQIICEFHGLDRLGDRQWRSRARRVAEKLRRTHCAIHVHGNNFKSKALVISTLVPTAIEISFGRVDAYRMEPGTDVFPTALDSPNDPAAPDYFLGSFRPG
jgi:glycosyltransferase involved in cell wall biosynthesis